MFEFHPITEQEVVAHLSKLNCWKASGLDDISTRILKECRHALCVPLSHIFNTSISSGQFAAVETCCGSAVVQGKGQSGFAAFLQAYSSTAVCFESVGVICAKAAAEPLSGRNLSA